MTNNRRHASVMAAVAVAIGVAGAAAAEEHEEGARSPWRGDISIGAQTWPGLSDLKPLDGGSFDTTGFSLSVAAHYSWRTFEDSELMIGGDLGFMSNDSSIALSFEDVTARAMYIGPSVKWMFGRTHDYSFDFGIMYWDIDFAEVESDYPYYFENVVWDESAVGGYVGMTWDKDAGDPTKESGMTLNLKVHFVDFGDVTGGDPFLLRTFGPVPGRLEGPIYQMQIGYRMR